MCRPKPHVPLPPSPGVETVGRRMDERGALSSGGRDWAGAHGCSGEAGPGRGRPPGLSSHLQDEVVQGAFVLSQRLHHSSHLGQGIPLLHSLCLEPAHEQFQVSFAGLGLGRGGQRSPSREARMGSRSGGAAVGWGASCASWRHASWSSGGAWKRSRSGEAPGVDGSPWVQGCSQGRQAGSPGRVPQEQLWPALRVMGQGTQVGDQGGHPEAGAREDRVRRGGGGTPLRLGLGDSL